MNKYLLSIFFLIILVGCSSDTPPVEGERDQAQFIVGIVTAGTTQEAGMNQISSLKRGKVINFKTCLKDSAYITPVQRELFTITGGKEPIEKSTLEDGCLYWSEEVNIEDLTTMGAIETTRTITGKGTYRGSVSVKLAIKPLSNGGSSVVDLRYKDIPASEEANKQREEGVSFLMGEISITPMISIMTQEELMTAFRKVKLQISVTIMDPEGQGVTNHPFKIAFIDGAESTDDIDWDKIPEVNSDERSGQHVTSSVVEYKRFTAEYYMKKYVVVKSLEKPFENVVQKREVYINPWQWWGRFFFWDSKWDVPGQVPLYRKVEKRKPQMLLQEIFLSYTGNDENSYDVNQYMDLTFKKNYQIKFRPLLNRKVSYVPGQDMMMYELVHIAQLKAKLVLIRPKDGVLDLKKLSERGIEGLEDYEYVTGKEVILKVHENLAQGNFSFEFDFRQTPFMVTRSLLLAEISPANPDWDVEPVVVTITMKSGEFWITEGALFATELFNGINDEGIGIFQNNRVEQNVAETKPFAEVTHPAGEAGMGVIGEDGEMGDLTASADKDPDIRYIYMQREDAQDEQDEITRIPEHLRLRERATTWAYDPHDLFVKIQERSAEIEGHNFHYPKAHELSRYMRNQFEKDEEEYFYGYPSPTPERRVELERNLGKKALYNLTRNRAVFEDFLTDPYGVKAKAFIDSRTGLLQPLKELAEAIGIKKRKYYGGSREHEQLYFDTLMSLANLFYHDGFYPARHHIHASYNPMEYYKITPLTFLTEDPDLKDVRKVIAGRDTMPIGLGMLDVYSQSHSESHSINASFALSPRMLVGGEATTVSRASFINNAAGATLGTSIGVVRGSHSRSRSWFKDMSQKKDAIITSDFMLLIDQLLLEFDAKSRSCLLIEARVPNGYGDFETYFYAYNNDRDAYMVCFPEENKKRTFQEMWYFINTANTDSTHFVDHNNLANRPIVMPLRGLKNFADFRNNLVRRAEDFIVMKKEEFEPLARHAFKDLFNVKITDIPEFLSDGEFPGNVVWDFDGQMSHLNTTENVTKLGIFGQEL